MINYFAKEFEIVEGVKKEHLDMTNELNRSRDSPNSTLSESSEDSEMVENLNQIVALENQETKGFENVTIQSAKNSKSKVSKESQKE